MRIAKIFIDNVAQRATFKSMIISFKHKGLENFFAKGSMAGIQANHKNKLRMQLTALNTAHVIEDMNLPGYRLHPLKGERRRFWAIRVSGNWRLTFRFENGNVHLLNYEDYH
jgi:toxin HigB-1